MTLLLFAVAPCRAQAVFQIGPDLRLYKLEPLVGGNQRITDYSSPLTPGDYHVHYQASVGVDVFGSSLGYSVTDRSSIRFLPATAVTVTAALCHLQAFAWVPCGAPRFNQIDMPVFPFDSSTAASDVGDGIGAAIASASGGAHAVVLVSGELEWVFESSLVEQAAMGRGTPSCPDPNTYRQIVTASSAITYDVFFSVSQSCSLTVPPGLSSATRSGFDQSFPDYPCARDNVSFRFCDAASGHWFDPPLALGYEFAMEGASRFTDILSLPVGIDADGQFEVLVGGQSLGTFAAGSRVDLQALVGAPGVTAFQVVGIDPAIDSTDMEGFPIQLAFDTAMADFTMTPMHWRTVGASCVDPGVCASCGGIALATVGLPVIGNQAFALTLEQAPAQSVAAFFIGAGHPSSAPPSLLCGTVVLPLPFFDAGVVALPGQGTCDGAGVLPLPLPNASSLSGAFVTAQSAFVCPGGGLGLSHGVEFAIGD